MLIKNGPVVEAEVQKDKISEIINNSISKITKL